MTEDNDKIGTLEATGNHELCRKGFQARCHHRSALGSLIQPKGHAYLDGAQKYPQPGMQSKKGEAQKFPPATTAKMPRATVDTTESLLAKGKCLVETSISKFYYQAIKVCDAHWDLVTDITQVLTRWQLVRQLTETGPNRAPSNE